MTSRLLAGLLLLLVCVSLHAQTPAPAPPTPNALMAEFITLHDDGVKRLSAAYLARLEAEKQNLTRTSNLHGAKAVDEAMRQMQNPAAKKPITVPNLPTPAVTLLKEHAAQENTAVSTLARNYIAKLQALKAQLLNTGDTEAAAQADRCLLELSTFIKPLPGAIVDEITVEAYIDGNTTLHVTKDGLYWQTDGNVAKPGLHDKTFYPTYINGNAWIPQWKAEGTRGSDTSDTYPITTAAPQLKFEHIATSKDRSAAHEPGRTAPESSFTKNEFTILIADPESGARWQKFRLKAAK